MPAERYFIDDTFHSHDKKILKGSEFHHLAHVMRSRKGEEVELVNGRGGLAQAVVQEILKDQAILIVNQVEKEEPRSPRVILAQAMPKINRLDFVLEKGTELGVDEFWLFPGEQSVKKEFFPHQLERLHTLVIAAMKQCGRLFLPQIILKPELKRWPMLEGIAFFGDVEKDATLFSKKWEQTKLSSPIIFFVGPESGFTEDEVNDLKKRGVQGVKLHYHILRTETAPLVALSLIEHWLISKEGSVNIP